MCYNRADIYIYIYIDLTCNPRVVDNMDSLSYHLFSGMFTNLIFITIMFTDHQSNQSDPPEPDENHGTRPTYNTSQTQSAPDILTAAGKLYDDLMAGILSLETLQDSHIVEEIAQQLVQGKDAMRDKRTAKLWLQYLEMVEILLSFIKSDMTGNSQLHLKMGQAMLPFLAAAGHNN